MLHGIRMFTGLLACAAMMGCSANDLMLKRQGEAEAKIEHLIQSAKKSEQRQNDFSAQLQGQDERFRSYDAQIRQLQDSLKELRNAQDELKGRLALLSQQGTTPRVEVVNPAQPPKTARESGPPADYLKAFGLYSANNFAAAIKSFELFVKNNPNSEYMANALYWIGECHYSLSDLPKARETFLKVAGSYPDSPKAPDALLKLGYTLAAMKEKEKATAIFESLIKSYPSSPAAIKARERLNANAN